MSAIRARGVGSGPVPFIMFCMLLLAAPETCLGAADAGAGGVPALFAPGVVSTDEYFEISCTLSPDGREFFFTRRGGEFGDTNTIMVTRWVDNRWSEPAVAFFSGTHFDFEPHMTSDGKRIYFGSTRPAPEGAEPGRGSRIWCVDREGDRWTHPRYVCNGMFASATAGGDLYVTRDRDGVSRLPAGSADPFAFTSLGDPINLPRADFHPFVSPAEDYLIFDSYDRPENAGGADLYLSFRLPDGAWSTPRNLGPQVNTPGWEGCPFVSRDGKVLFFTREGDIYFVEFESLAAGLRP